MYNIHVTVEEHEQCTCQHAIKICIHVYMFTNELNENSFKIYKVKGLYLQVSVSVSQEAVGCG